ncbi:acyltransferase family protein [Prevotella sp. E2-28]|uniref:acyltransferase family protein n=1 Tax=Prevotella sp. E2-28 TaxID=2913620 RepID=UPI0034CED26A
MGVATILIILCHMPAHGVVMPNYLSILLSHGGAGCDLFLFLSGLGMYHSLNTNKMGGRNTFSWFKKRLFRLLVPYLLICAPIFVVFALRDHWTLSQYFLRLSTISFYTEGWGLWFLALIIVLYVITPLFYKLFTGRSKREWLFFLICVAWLPSTLSLSQGFFFNVLFCLCRIPCFLLGLYFADDILTNKQIKLRYASAAILCLFIASLLLNNTGVVTISYIWIERLLVLITFVLIINRMKHNTIVLNILKFMGSISLESYCTNVFVLPFFTFISWKIGTISINPGNWTYYILGTSFCILISLLINKISGQIIKRPS